MQYVVRLAAGGVYGPFDTEAKARQYGEALAYGPFTTEPLGTPDPWLIAQKTLEERIEALRGKCSEPVLAWCAADPTVLDFVERHQANHRKAAGRIETRERVYDELLRLTGHRKDT